MRQVTQVRRTCFEAGAHTVAVVHTAAGARTGVAAHTVAVAHIAVAAGIAGFAWRQDRPVVATPVGQSSDCCHISGKKLRQGRSDYHIFDKSSIFLQT